ncbi:hypothetical protein [Edaphobacter aggregans]|uniref:hypothetical protein n=1 Tax=Edaphobacter aggregans TaxID=570835 RepID=UPI0005546BA0|nr:hypothetical protein [Edaphobacter aggregans]
MEIAAILREIDAEIERLQYIRTIVEGLAWPAPRKQKQPRKQKEPRQPKPVPQEPIIATPTLTFLPPKQRTEYRRRKKPAPEQPRALSSAVPDKPVFVPRAAVSALTEIVTKPVEFTPEALEAALRQNFLGTHA